MTTRERSETVSGGGIFHDLEREVHALCDQVGDVDLTDEEIAALAAGLADVAIDRVNEA